MNRRERRAAQSHASSAGQSDAGHDEVMTLFVAGLERMRSNELSPAIRLFKKVLELRPDHVAACDRLAAAYLAQGKRDKAAEQYAALARMAPQTLGEFARVLDTLKMLLPELAAELANAAAAPELDAPNVRAIAANPFFRVALEQSTVCDGGLERWLTKLRESILRAISHQRLPAGDDIRAFCSALARQCFINEYVFFATPEEAELVAGLKAKEPDAIDAGALLALAMYMPLHQLSGADTIATRTWPHPAAAVVAQQIIEPREEIALRGSIARLTPIADGVTAQVRRQYEENPYPRWATLEAPPWPLVLLDEHLRRWFPAGPFRPVGHEESLDVLVVGCGTGRHVLELAQSYRGAHVLAVDLSLASLAHARRRTPGRLSDKVEFAQADIMALGSLGRSFDLINATGVFHHMPDPWAGWREIVKLMKADGVMQVGLYSALGRRDVVAARQIIAERGYKPTAEDIRRLRHDLAVSGDNFSFTRLGDYFTVSTCRDLLFHVHEVQTTIPEIKAFLADNGLRFIGFDFGAPEGQEHYRNLFARNGWSLSDLDRWDAFERENPQAFAGMYIFWVQKL
jgi:SAM-dependent methyltransferase